MLSPRLTGAIRSRRFRLDRQLRATLDPRTGKARRGFETRAKAEVEDKARARLIDRSIAGTGTLSEGVKLDKGAARRLSEGLERGVETGEPPVTLASFLHMRDVRLTLFGAMLETLDDIPDKRLRTITVINTQWALTAEELEAVTAATIKRQFRTHLQRAGILDLRGFLVAFLHGEFEPTTGMYQLHFHVATTAWKAAAVKRRLKGRWGYEKTPTGAAPIVRKKVTDRPRQLSYLLKSYWPEKPVVMINSQPKRARTPRRIKGPHHTQVLLWLNRQSLSDLMLCNRCLYRNGNLFLS